MTSKTTNLNKHGAIMWNTTIFMIIFHAGAIASLFMLPSISWKIIPVTLVLWWVSGSLGIGMGFHRLLTHRGYKTPKVVEYFLTFCGLLALEADQSIVVTHRIHHANTDHPATRTLRATGAGGPTWDGFYAVRRNNTMRRRCSAMRPT